MTIVASANVLSAGPQGLRNHKSSEADMVAHLVRHLRKKYAIEAYGTEIKSHGRCRTDICIVVRMSGSDRGSPVVVGIEAKLASTERVLQQAILNKYGVDGSFVAMPANRISDDLLALAFDYGLGVLAVSDGEISVALPATLGTPDGAIRTRMMAQLKIAGRRSGDSAEGLVREGAARDVQTHSGLW